MTEWISRVSRIDEALLLALLLAAILTLPTSRRGGRFRGLPGWIGFWVFFTGVLLALEHGWRWVSFTLLAFMMFDALRNFFFVAPVRARDRYAILAAYLAIPVALYPAYQGSEEGFLATIPAALFLFIPVFLAMGRPQEGMLDAMGRTLLGVLFFVFCTAHLGLLVELPPFTGLPAMFGVMVLAAEVPRRLAGDFSSSGEGWTGPLVGAVVGILGAAALGFWLGPECGIEEEDAARCGLLTGIAVTCGALVSNAVVRDLDLSSLSARVGRGAYLGRVVPAVYAAPVFFHYLDHFAP